MSEPRACASAPTRPSNTISPPCSPGPGTDVDQAVGGLHDLRIVLDHDERIAGIAQPLHHADDAPHVARVQTDGRLVEHEQRVDQRGAERGGEIDPLDLAAGQRARLPIEVQVAETDVGQILEPRAHLGEQQIGGLIERRGQREPREKFAALVDGLEHELADIEAGLAEAPEQRIRLQSGARASAALGVGAVAREQHPDVHLVRLGLEPGEETPDAVPDLLRPFAFALDHPVALLVAELGPWRVDGNAALARELDQILLALLV